MHLQPVFAGCPHVRRRGVGAPLPRRSLPAQRIEPGRAGTGARDFDGHAGMPAVTGRDERSDVDSPAAPAPPGSCCASGAPISVVIYLGLAWVANAARLPDAVRRPGARAGVGVAHGHAAVAHRGFGPAGSWPSASSAACGGTPASTTSATSSWPSSRARPRSSSLVRWVFAQPLYPRSVYLIDSLVLIVLLGAFRLARRAYHEIAVRRREQDGCSSSAPATRAR